MIIDLRAPTIVRGFRTQGVQRLDNRLAYPTAIRLMYADELADKFRELRNADGSQVEFRVLDGATQSIMNLPNPIEARFNRLNIINFETAPCMKIEINGCGRQSCQDVNECNDKVIVIVIVIIIFIDVIIRAVMIIFTLITTVFLRIVDATRSVSTRLARCRASVTLAMSSTPRTEPRSSLCLTPRQG